MKKFTLFIVLIGALAIGACKSNSNTNANQATPTATPVPVEIVTPDPTPSPKTDPPILNVKKKK